MQATPIVGAQNPLGCHHVPVTVLLASHDSSLAHDTGPRHPERPARIPAVIEGVRTAGIEVLDLRPEQADLSLITAIHSPDYVEDIRSFCGGGGGALDLDTHAGSASWDAALRAAGAGVQVADALREGTADFGFVAMRPPGHHAEWDRAMGFCLFNNVAVTAAYLTERGDRVAIVDWDVHHGNGTQRTFYSDDRVLYLSLHQAGIYPGTGSGGELGEGSGEGTNLNIAVPAGTGGQFYRKAMLELVTPVFDQFSPDWVLVSAGYDAHAADPLAGLMLLEADYGFMAQTLARLSVPSRAVVFLEGGYDLSALEGSARATVQGWAGANRFDRDASMGRMPVGLMDRINTLWSRYWDLH